MKKFIFGSMLVLVALVLFSSVPVLAVEKITQFNNLISIKSGNYTEVHNLQHFLINQGFLKDEADGIFGPITLSAVKAFQTSQGLKADGIFGPLSRAVANIMVLAQTNKSATTVSIKSVSGFGNNLAASPILSGYKSIVWETSNYIKNIGVNINLIRKTSTSPTAYTLVRTIAKDTPNDGQENWTPRIGENTSDLYIEVTCSSTYNFTQGCKASAPIPIK